MEVDPTGGTALDNPHKGGHSLPSPPTSASGDHHVAPTDALDYIPGLSKVEDGRMVLDAPESGAPIEPHDASNGSPAGLKEVPSEVNHQMEVQETEETVGETMQPSSTQQPSTENSKTPHDFTDNAQNVDHPPTPISNPKDSPHDHHSPSASSSTSSHNPQHNHHAVVTENPNLDGGEEPKIEDGYMTDSSEDTNLDSDGSTTASESSDDDESLPFPERRKRRHERKERHRKGLDRQGRKAVRPAYYYDPNATSFEQSFDDSIPGSGIGPAPQPVRARMTKRARRKGEGIPVFEPTMEEFEDFYEYCKQIDRFGMRSAVVKVVPPKEWTESLPSVSAPLKDTRLRNPIAQVIQGSSGMFRVRNVTRSRIYNAKQWRELSETERWTPPDFFKPVEKEDENGGGRRTRSAGVGRPSVPSGSGRGRGRRSVAKTSTTIPAVKEEKEGMDEEKKESPPLEAPQAQGEEIKPEPSTEESVPGEKQAKSEEGEAGVEAAVGSIAEAEADVDGDAVMLDDEGNLILPPSTPFKDIEASTIDKNSALSPENTSPDKNKLKRPTPAQLAIPTDEEWSSFDYISLPHGAKARNYTEEACREIERMYWRTIGIGTGGGNGESAMYGADMKGSLFDGSVKSWNVAHLDNLLNRLKFKIPGVNTPYLYFGMWKATFAWHVEDMNLYSINYIHFGAPKFWYSIPQASAGKFERLMESFFPTDRKACSEFLRHKSFLISPSVLANNGIPLNRVVQLPGEFMITYPRGYHSGFNMGFNCAESINFALETWLDYGRNAKACSCVGDSVTINVDAMLAEAAENEAKELAKRKRAAISTTPSQPRRKKVKLDPDGQGSNASTPAHGGSEVSTPSTSTANGVKDKTKKKEATKKEKPPKPEFVCALCPDPTVDTLIRIVEPEGTAMTAAGKKSKVAHKICCMFTPSTYIEVDAATGEEIVRGFEGIEKARWSLKCQLCTEKHGTKVQCTRNAKCVRAFHVTCALKEGSGVIVDAILGEGPAAISLLEQAKQATEAEGEGSASGTANGVVGLTETQANASLGSEVAKAAAADMKAGEGEFKMVVLCRQHNPEYAKAQAEQKAKDLVDRVAALAIGSRLKIRASSGVFEVTLLGNKPEKQSVQVVYDDGARKEFKYRSIIWPDSPESKAAERKAAAMKLKEAQQDVWVYDGPRPAQRNRSESSLPQNSQQPVQQPHPYPPALGMNEAPGPRAYGGQDAPNVSQAPRPPVPSDYPAPRQPQLNAHSAHPPASPQRTQDPHRPQTTTTSSPKRSGQSPQQNPNRSAQASGPSRPSVFDLPTRIPDSPTRSALPKPDPPRPSVFDLPNRLPERGPTESNKNGYASELQGTLPQHRRASVSYGEASGHARERADRSYSRVGGGYPADQGYIPGAYNPSAAPGPSTDAASHLPGVQDLLRTSAEAYYASQRQKASMMAPPASTYQGVPAPYHPGPEPQYGVSHHAPYDGTSYGRPTHHDGMRNDQVYSPMGYDQSRGDPRYQDDRYSPADGRYGHGGPGGRNVGDYAGRPAAGYDDQRYPRGTYERDSRGWDLGGEQEYPRPYAGDHSQSRGGPYPGY